MIPRLARCSRGQLGLVTRRPHAITYPDGTSSEAWTGYHLPKFWRRWSSRPRDWDKLLAESEQLRKALERAAYIAGHLVQQVPEFTGVIGPEGQKEDDYIYAQLYEEINSWKALAQLARRRPGGDSVVTETLRKTANTHEH